VYYIEEAITDINEVYYIEEVIRDINVGPVGLTAESRTGYVIFWGRQHPTIIATHKTVISL